MAVCIDAQPNNAHEYSIKMARNGVTNGKTWELFTVDTDVSDKYAKQRDFKNITFFNAAPDPDKPLADGDTVRIKEITQCKITKTPIGTGSDGKKVFFKDAKNITWGNPATKDGITITDWANKLSFTVLVEKVTGAQFFTGETAPVWEAAGDDPFGSDDGDLPF